MAYDGIIFQTKKQAFFLKAKIHDPYFLVSPYHLPQGWVLHSMESIMKEKKTGVEIQMNDTSRASEKSS